MKLSRYWRAEVFWIRRVSWILAEWSARYALPLARKAKHITLTDISENMLKLAKENAEQNGIQNIAFKKLEEKAALSSLGWERMFDLAFAAMCPAIRTICRIV